MTYGLMLVGATALGAPSSLAVTQTTVACYREATVTMPVQPDLPRVHLNSKVTLEASVAVGPDGAVKSVEILESSGYQQIDAEVVKAATESKYKPKMVDCQPADGTYLFRVDYSPY